MEMSDMDDGQRGPFLFSLRISPCCAFPQPTVRQRRDSRNGLVHCHFHHVRNKFVRSWARSTGKGASIRKVRVTLMSAVDSSYDGGYDTRSRSSPTSPHIHRCPPRRPPAPSQRLPPPVSYCLQQPDTPQVPTRSTRK